MREFNGTLAVPPATLEFYLLSNSCIYKQGQLIFNQNITTLSLWCIQSNDSWITEHLTTCSSQVQSLELFILCLEILAIVSP